LRIRLFHNNDALVFDNLGLHLLLFIRFQVALLLGLLAHPLHRIHHIALLGQKRIAQISGPLDIVCQPLDHVRQPGQRLDACIPWLLGHSIGESFVF
jgi:hypothetical protein